MTEIEELIKQAEDTRGHKAEIRKKLIQFHKDERARLKPTVLTHYGNGKLACVKCGFDDIKALTIDHIDGNGANHRRAIGVGAGNSFYRWLKENNFPEGYQVLCMNCQWIKMVDQKEYAKHWSKPRILNYWRHH